MKEQQNFLAAIVLSLAVLLGWQFFVVEPRMAAERAQRLAAAQSEEAAAQNGTDMAPQVENAPQADGLTKAEMTSRRNCDASRCAVWMRPINT